MYVIIPMPVSLFHAHLGGRSFAKGGIKLMAGVAFFDGEGEAFGLVVVVEGGDMDGVARAEVGFDDLVGEVVLDVVLDGALEGSGSVLLVPAFAEDEVLGFVVDVYAESHLVHPLEESL